MSEAKHFRDAVGIWQDEARCLPFIKGRVALFAILKSLGIGEGDEVLVPGFTCVVVPAAVCYTGAVPVFYDIDRASLHGNTEAAVAALTPRTRAVLIQHNFGMLAPSNELIGRCRARGLAVIEDCAHALGAVAGNQAAGTLGDAAFCSLQWSKPTTTGLGGIARFNDAALWQRGREIYENEFSEPAIVRMIYLGFLSSVFRRWYRPSWYWTVQGLYRWAGRRGLVQGSSSDGELTSGEMPAQYRERFGNLRRGSLTGALSDLPDLLQHRREMHALYQRSFADRGTWQPPTEQSGQLGAALRYPMLVENRPELLVEARRQRVEIGDWFNAPLHPQESRPEAFGYQAECCPNGEAAASRVINLPTHRHVGKDVAGRIVEFIDRHAELTPLDRWLTD